MKIFGICKPEDADQLVKVENGLSIDYVGINEKNKGNDVLIQTADQKKKISLWQCTYQLIKLIIICLLISSIVFSFAATICLKNIINDPSLVHEKNYNYRMLQCSQLAKLYWKNFQNDTSLNNEYSYYYDDDPIHSNE